MDLCCGMTMVCNLQSVYTDGVLLHDVPMLYCPTCERSILAPQIELDYQMFAYNCSSDGLRTANLADAIGDEKILDILDTYPQDERVTTGKSLLPEQVDALLDQIILAKSIDDEKWQQDLLAQLELFRSIGRVNQR